MEIRRFLLTILLSSAAVFSLSAQSSRPIVTDIKAVQSVSETTVTWNIPEDCQISSVPSLYIYRSSEAILSSSQLLSLAPVAVLPSDTTSWKEKAESSLYYYAVIARLSDGSLYDLLIPTVNTTLYPATVSQSVPEKKEAKQPEITFSEPAAENGMRIKPLPAFRIFTPELDSQKTISVETLSAVQDFGLEASRESDVSLFIAEEDMSDTATGDTYLLHEIVSRYLLRKNWTGALEEMNTLMQTYHSEIITARVNLYRGQCSYYLKDYLSALQYFLQCEAFYPDVSKVWIQTVINAFVLPDLSE